MNQHIQIEVFKCTHPHLCNTAICYRQNRAQLIVPVHVSFELEREFKKGSCQIQIFIIIVA